MGYAKLKEAELSNQQNEETIVDNFELPNDLKNINFENILEGVKFSDEELAKLIKSHANDNFPSLPTDPDELTKVLDQVDVVVKKEVAILKSAPLSEEEYFKRLKVAQQHAAYKLLAECVIGEDMRRIDKRQGLKKDPGIHAEEQKKTKSDIIREKYPRLGSRQVRDFQHLYPESVLAAIKIAFKRGEIVTRSLALANISKKEAREAKSNVKTHNRKCWEIKEEYFEIVYKKLFLEEPLHATSLFSCNGTGTSLLDRVNIHVKVANEKDPRRAEAHAKLHPNCQMIAGSIADEVVFNQVKDAHLKENCELIFSSPPCQESSGLNTSKDKGKKAQAVLFYDTVKFIEATKPQFALIENVPTWLTDRPDAALSILGEKTIGEYIVEELDRLGYKTTVGILSAADYETAEDRERCIILACKKELGVWLFPKKHEVRPVLFDVISDFKSLKPGEIDPNDKWHYALDLEPHETEFLAHTPTSCSAWDNLPIYQPSNKSGSYSGAQFDASYTRLSWEKLGKTITTGSGQIGSTYTVHPGRPLSDGTYSDCRTLSIAELLRIIGCQDGFLEPLNGMLTWENGRLIKSDEHFIREILGEHVCPKFMLNLVSTLPIPKKSKPVK